MMPDIPIGFDNPNALICALLSRFELNKYHIYIDNHSAEIIIYVNDTYLKIGDQQLNFPIIFNEFVNSVRKESYAFRT